MALFLIINQVCQKKNKMARSRSFCFTLNNYSELDCELIKTWGTKYLIFGKEIGESGTPHLQGYVVFENARTLAQLKKKYSASAHWEIAKGTPKQASEYCEKDGDFFEKGVRPVEPLVKGLMEKDRWIDIRRLALAGDWDVLGQKYPKEAINSEKALIRHVELVQKRKNPAVTIQGSEMPHRWYYGLPGTGKSMSARDEFPGAYIKDPQTKWWDGYVGQKVAIIEDFDKYQKAQGGDMKRWMDRYPFQAEFKGGMSIIRPEMIIVTSNYTPDEIWDDEITVSAVSRRITLREFVGAPVVKPMSLSPPEDISPLKRRKTQSTAEFWEREWEKKENRSMDEFTQEE